MQFLVRKRRQAPAIIIVSLIDILIVLLIFLLVTTSFKRQPALQLVLPESKQAKGGAVETALVVTVDKDAFLYLNERLVTLDRLQAELSSAAARNPGVTLSIRADGKAPVEQLVKVMDASKAAGIKTAGLVTRTPGSKP